MIRPLPGRSFRWRQTSAGAALVCEPLEAFAKNIFTTRAWMLGTRRVDVTERASWDQVSIELDTPVARMRQIHGRDVVIATHGGQAMEGDILMTQQADLSIAVQAADCVPLLFVDPGKGAVAAAHAGWRGMVAGVPQVTVEALGRDFGCRADDLVVAAGPSIGACCYEVGSDVRDAFIAAGWVDRNLRSWFHGEPIPIPNNPSMPRKAPRADHWFFDGWACIRHQLMAAGVRADRIHSAELCTASHPAIFPSYRRDGVSAGRIAGVIRLGGLGRSAR